MISVIIPCKDLNNVGKTLPYWKDADEIIIAYDPDQQVVDNLSDGVARAKGDILVFANDRVIMRGDWRKIVEQKLRGVLSFSPHYATNGAIERMYMEEYQNGYIYWPDYLHHFADLELVERAKKNILYDEVEDMYFCLPKEEKQVDKDKQFRQYKYDNQMYWKRRKLGFPNQFIADDKKREKATYIY